MYDSPNEIAVTGVMAIKIKKDISDMKFDTSLHYYYRLCNHDACGYIIVIKIICLFDK
jgi:hypothetical protein